MDDNLERKEVEQYRKDFNIKCHDIDVNVSTLSGGNQQKVLLAKWVISQPDILILDEPTRGIDVGAKYEIYEIIDKLADAGKAVIVISSSCPSSSVSVTAFTRCPTVSSPTMLRRMDLPGIPDEGYDQGKGGGSLMSAALQHLQRKKKRPACWPRLPTMPVNTVLSAHCWSSSWPSRSDRRRAAEAELLRVPDSAERLRDHLAIGMVMVIIATTSTFRLVPW